jgi:hypothetical protein
MNYRHLRHGGEQHFAVCQLAVLRNADQKVRVDRQRHGKLLVDIAFPVLNMGDVRGLFEYLVGRLDAFQPAIGFLLFDRAPVVVDRGPLAAHIDLRPDQPQAMPIFSVNRQGRMQEQANLGAVSHRAQAASAAGMPLIAQFGGILDGQDVTPGYAVRNFLPATLVKLFNRHGLVPQPTAKCDFLSNAARQLTQANVELLRHSLRQQRPFFSAVRRRSCQPPSKKSPLPTSRLSQQTESHTSYDQHNVLPLAKFAGAVAGRQPHVPLFARPQVQGTPDMSSTSSNNWLIASSRSSATVMLCSAICFGIKLRFMASAKATPWFARHSLSCCCTA